MNPFLNIDVSGNEAIASGELEGCVILCYKKEIIQSSSGSIYEVTSYGMGAAIGGNATTGMYYVFEDPTEEWSISGIFEAQGKILGVGPKVPVSLEVSGSKSGLSGNVSVVSPVGVSGSLGDKNGVTADAGSTGIFLPRAYVSKAKLIYKPKEKQNIIYEPTKPINYCQAKTNAKPLMFSPEYFSANSAEMQCRFSNSIGGWK